MAIAQPFVTLLFDQIQQEPTLFCRICHFAVCEIIKNVPNAQIRLLTLVDDKGPRTKGVQSNLPFITKLGFCMEFK